VAANAQDGRIRGDGERMAFAIGLAAENVRRADAIAVLQYGTAGRRSTEQPRAPSEEALGQDWSTIVRIEARQKY
jgi:hypothetical protein